MTEEYPGYTPLEAAVGDIVEQLGIVNESSDVAAALSALTETQPSGALDSALAAAFEKHDKDSDALYEAILTALRALKDEMRVEMLDLVARAKS